MDTCRTCGAEISPAEGYFNDNQCNACAFGLPDSACQFNEQPVVTSAWETEWEQMNDVRDAVESFNEVPSYFERFQQEKLNREALAQVE